MQLPDGWTTGTVDAGGVDLQYYRAGEGLPVVLAHGFYENGRCWAPLVEDLRADYDVIAYDARGHGRSDAPPSGYAVEDRVADLRAVVDELGLGDPILVGHSMGGSTVAWTAATHPSLPRAVVMEDPACMVEQPDRPDSELVEVVHDRLETWADRSVEEQASTYDDLDDDLARRLAVAHTECRPEIANVPRRGYPPAVDAFPDVECPALVLKADDDPEQRARELDAADELPDGRLVHVPDAGHTVFRDEYDAAYRELRAFLERV